MLPIPPTKEKRGWLLKEMLHQYSVPREALMSASPTAHPVLRLRPPLRRQPADGVCRVRFNDNGTLLVPTATLAPWPAIRSKRTVLPRPARLGRLSSGCSLRIICGYCQNGSQPMLATPTPVAPARIDDRNTRRPGHPPRRPVVASSNTSR